MKWKRINRVRSLSSCGYVIEALGDHRPYVYVIWPPVKPGDVMFKFPHRVIQVFGDGSEKEKVEKAKLFCEQHFIEGEKDAA